MKWLEPESDYSRLMWSVNGMRVTKSASLMMQRYSISS